MGRGASRLPLSHVVFGGPSLVEGAPRGGVMTQAAGPRPEPWHRLSPGASPFRVRGNVVLGYLRYCDDSIPGGRQAVLARVDNPAVEQFFAQPFLVGGLYDVLPLVPLGQAMALVSGLPYRELLRRHATVQADRDISTVYRLMLKLASPQQVVRALPGTARRYFDFVSSVVREVRAGQWEVTIRGVPAPLAQVYKSATEAFIVRALELAGAKGLRHRWLSESISGEQQGIATLELVRELAWRP